MEEDSGGGECVEGVTADRKISRKLESSDVMCNTGLTLRSGDGGTDRENIRGCRFVKTTGSRGLRE